MITRLISIFDPSSMTLSLGWLITFFCFSLNFRLYMKSSIYESLKISLFIYPLFKDLKSSIIKLGPGKLVSLVAIFSIFMILNLLSIYPYTFTPTGQISVVLPLSLIFWTGVNFLGWFRNFFNALSHLVPQGTPQALINFMVLVELISNIIRPITLSVRLVANMVAGHLLLSLLGGLAEGSKLVGIVSFFPLLLLRGLELSVCFIQSYVFITLISLYIKEYI